MQLEKNRISYCSLDITSTPTTLNPSINAEVFFAASAGYGDFIYTYDGSLWRDSNGMGVNLANYGISITGSPSSGDEITVTVGDWSLKITSEGTYAYTINNTWELTTLKDFSISYKEDYTICF